MSALLAIIIAAFALGIFIFIAFNKKPSEEELFEEFEAPSQFPLQPPVRPSGSLDHTIDWKKLTVEVITCGADGIPGVKALWDILAEDKYIVLECSFSDAEKQAQIERLKGLLEGCEVFDSGGDSKSTWITILPAMGGELSPIIGPLKTAFEKYARDCSILYEKAFPDNTEPSMESYERFNSLSNDWELFFHGGAVCFTNLTTDQVVEIPLGGHVDIYNVDPYFFLKYLESTPEYSYMAEALDNDFNNIHRALKILRDSFYS